MKYLKIMLFAVIMAFTFGSAKAQHVVVQARVGGGHDYYYHHHHYHHRHWRHNHWEYR